MAESSNQLRRQMKTGQPEPHCQPPRPPLHDLQGTQLKLQMLANQHLGFGIKPLPAGGELCSLAATVKQPGTKQRFQRLDLFAQRRLGDTQPLRRQAIITLFSQHHKGA